MAFRQLRTGGLVRPTTPVTDSLKSILTLRFPDFNHPSGSTLGLFTAIVNIGGFSALFFCQLGIQAQRDLHTC